MHVLHTLVSRICDVCIEQLGLQIQRQGSIGINAEQQKYRQKEQQRLPLPLRPPGTFNAQEALPVLPNQGAEFTTPYMKMFKFREHVLWSVLQDKPVASALNAATS